MKRKNWNYSVFSILLFFALSACGGGGNTSTSTSNTQSAQTNASNLPPLPTSAITYIQPPIQGKLPYPHHNPAFTANQYEQMRSTTWIMNNFSMYQGDDEGSQYMYLHDGLDFMLNDGTPVYAVKAGIVRDTSSGSITVEDDTAVGTGWQMAHLTLDPRLKPGDTLRQGQYVGVVAPQQGHTHFNYIARATSGSWYLSTFSMYPNDLFDLPDRSPPVFDSTLRFFQNASDTEIKANSGLHGKVDIVVAARDVSSNYPVNSKSRCAPALFEMTILNADNKPLWTHQSNLRKLILTPPFLGDKVVARREVELMFKKPNLMETASWTQKGYLWWNLTNLPQHLIPKTISQRDEDSYWDTQAKDANGNPIFPNGLYTIRITATDAAGNQASMQETVSVKN